MKKVLIIAYWFHPFSATGSQRINNIVKYCKDSHWEPIILTVEDSPRTFNGPRSSQNLFDTTTIHRLKCFNIKYLLRRRKKIQNLFNSTNFTPKKRSFKNKLAALLYKICEYTIFFPDECISWYLLNRKKIIRIVDQTKPDLLFSSALPFTSHIIAHYIKKKRNVPWVADYRDLWTFSASRNAPLWPFRLVEQRTLRNTDLLTTVSNGLKNDQMGIFNGKIEVLENSFDTKLTPTQSKTPAYLKKEKINFVYTGRIYPKLSMTSPLLSFLSNSFKDYNKLSFHFFGDNSGHFFNNSILHGRSKDSIITHGQLSQNEALVAQAHADVLLLFGFPKSKGVLTAKFFEYLFSKTPIILFDRKDSELSLLLTKVGGGITICNQEELTLLIENICKDRSSLNSLVNYKPNLIEINKLTAQSKVAQLCKLFDNVVE